MMKKVLLLLLIIVSTANIASAQMLRFGFKGGVDVNQSDLTFSTVESGETDVLKSIENNSGYHFGMQLKLKLGLLYFQGDAMYTNNSYTYVDDYYNVSKFQEVNIECPVVVGLDLAFIRVYAGPRFIIPLGDDLETSINNIAGYSFKLDDNMAYQAGVGLDLFRRFTIDVSYNGYFSSFDNVMGDISGENFSMSHPDCRYEVSVGFYFGKTKKF